ncbi:MAG: hypothetical protein RSE18_00600 [Acinetobacter sp.]
MVFEKLSIDCESIENRNELFKILNSIGYIGIGDHDDFLFVQTYKDGSYQTYYEHDSTEQLTYKQFMEKYAMSGLKKKIEEAKKVTGLSASALSEKLGFQHKYLTNAVREASIQRQKEIIAKLDGLIFKEKNELTHDFEGKALNVNISDAVMVSKDEYDSLKKELNHKNQVLDKRNAVLENHIERVNELESQLKTTQQNFVDVVDQKDNEIKKLQNNCNHATKQYQGKREQVVQLSEKIKKKENVYMLVIVILLIASTIGFAS